MNERTIQNAMSPAELDDLQPPVEELLEDTWRASTWYNEAVWTAARLMVEAAEESDRFREDFMSEEKVEVEVEATPDESFNYTVETDKWRQTLEEELPEHYDDLMNIGLSAFQGNAAGSRARKYLKGDTK